MSNTADFSVEDEHYLSVVLGEPKMTMDEVGADIDEHGHIPVTPETATQDPFSTKGSLANALDELEGEIEGTTDTPQSGLIEPDADGIPPNEPMIQQDSAVSVKDSLSDALDAIVMDANPSDYTEEKDPMPRAKAPNLPTSLGGDEDKPDENGLVYITRTFTVDPNRYISTNYRPNPAQANINPINPLAKSTVNPQEEAELSDLGTPEARESAQESDEPTATEEAAAAQEANNDEQKEEEVVEVKETEDVIPAESKGKKSAKSAQDEAIAPQEKVALDYATFIDGSSFLCFDEISDIDYTKIAMDAGPKKKVTRENCQTTFAQCRAQNPLFCRFHGPKLLEADIKTQIRAYLGAGCVVSVTKDKASKNKFTFRLTVGCPPHLKDKVEQLIDMYMTQQPGISSAENGMTDISGDDKKNVLTQEFDMDILKADEPPKPASLGQKALYRTQEAERKGKVMPVVGDTPSQIEKKAKGGIAPQAAEESPAEPTEPQPEATPQETEPNVEETQEPIEETPPSPEPKETPPEEPPVGEPKAPSAEEGTFPQNEEEEIPDISDDELRDFLEKGGENPWHHDLDTVRSAITTGTTWGEELAPHNVEWYEDIINKAGADHKVSQIAAKTMAKLREQLGMGNKSAPSDSASGEETTSSGFEKIPNEPKVTEHDGENEDGTTETGSSDANGTAEPSERKSTAGTNGKAKGGVTPPELAADIALKGTPSPEIRKAAETIKDASDTAKNESRKAEELDKKGKTLKGNGEGGVIAKSAVDLAAAEAAKKAEEAKAKATKEAEALAKKQEESFRAAEKKSKGEAAATIEKTLTDMALSIFRQDSKSDSIEDEADSILNWMGDLAKKKGIDYTPSEEMSDAVAEIKKDAQQLEWLMGNLQKAMDATGGDFHSEDLDHIVGSLQRKASKISGAFSELNRMGMAEIARINQAADLANQKAKLMPKGSGETKGGATTSSRPTEQQFNEAAMLLANENIDTLDDAFAGLSALVDGKVQGFGAMSAEEIASEMADRYIKTLEKGGDKYKPMVDAIKSAIGKQKEAPQNDAAASPKQSSAGSSKKGDSRSRIEQVYKDWVEEEVPDWAKNLSDEEAAKYADLLEKAANWDSEKDGENTALHDLDAYEEGYRQKEAAAKEAEVKAKEEAKKAAEQKQADARKDILSATKRLGMDAYKPEAELRKLLAQARGHASGNPRMEQKVKDLEAVLADREAKKNLAPREGGKYVGDEMPNEEAKNLVAEMIIKALEG